MLKAGFRFVAAGMLAAVAMAAPAQAVSFLGPNVIGQVTPEGSGYRYSYTIDFTTFDLSSQSPIPPVISLSLPIFDADAVSDVQSPSGWFGGFQGANNATNWGYSAALDPNAGSYDAPAAAFEAPPLPYVVSWSIDELSPVSIGTATVAPGVNPGSSLGGFSFFSPYGNANAPTVMRLGFIGSTENGGITTLADPPVPNSPNSPFAQPNNGVPEPLTASLGAIALSALALGATRRRKA